MTEINENQVEEQADEIAADEAAASAAVEPQAQPEAQTDEKPEAQPAPLSKKKQFIQILKFTAFSASAGVIQFVTITTLHEWTGWLKDYYYIAFVIGLTLSVIWNFTFNRKFTFASASNVPLAMALVVLYNCIVVVPLALGGDALAELWGGNLGMVVTVLMMLINFVTEFLWDKFLVFNDRVMKKIEGLFKRKK